MLKKLMLWVPRLVALTERFPWAMPLFGFGSGLASFFLVERKEEIAQIIAVLMLASWVWLLVEKVLRRYVSRWLGLELPQSLMNFFAQLVHQESLFFIIPFFFITTSWNSGQMVFTALLMAAALVSIVDPLYFRWLAPRRWLYFTFHGVTLFAVLLTALPIIFQLPTAKTYLLSLAVALLITLPSVVIEMPWRWWQRCLAVVALATTVGFSAYLLRPWVPPATLWLTEVAITDHIDSKTRTPKKRLEIVTIEQLRSGLFAYTSIHAPRGLNERIYHVWTLNGRQIDKVALDINGGRAAGYRAWSHKLNFPQNALGRWQIRVVTEANQVIGVLRFRVVESGAKAAAPLIEAPSSEAAVPSPDAQSSEVDTPENVAPEAVAPETEAPEVEAPTKTELPLPATADGLMKEQLMDVGETSESVISE